jgi:hypothetical protein
MLKILMNGRRRFLFLILDCLPVHRAKIVSDYVASPNAVLLYTRLGTTESGRIGLELHEANRDSKAPTRERESLHDHRIVGNSAEFNSRLLVLQNRSVSHLLLTDQ